ncbi:uncharacterized protein [Aegilops tauschii subsp. strangulata]|uniref:uncharacterized protein n=1 Tax=Aegilops tauschii subsp. strangulata TaxID=200361 RepID=UPI00098A7234|nr:uncharacterized protein LOC109765319 [Aegilops tauschii subsp. strangulata]
MVGCLNGSVVTISHSVKNMRDDVAFEVRNPLRNKRGMAFLPGLNLTIREGCFYSWTQLFLKEEGDGSLSYFYVILENTADATKPRVHVYMLQNGDDAWHKHLTMADCDLYPPSWIKAVLVDNKIYMVNSPKEIAVLDLKASILSTIQLPHGVSIDHIGTTLLSRADDGYGLYLIHIKELQLQIWLYNGDNWLLVDTICLSEICADLFEDEPTADIRLNHVGDYTEFVFLEMGRCALYLDVKCRTLRKVYEMTADEFHLGDIYPFMTSWPPIFPALMDVPARLLVTLY